MKRLITILLLLLICFPAISQTRPSYYQLKDMPFTDLKAIGAKGNGTTDDTAIIQAAIASGGYIFFPEGTYKYNGGTDGYISVTKSVYLFGPGKIVVASSTQSLLAVGITMAANNLTCVVDGLTIDGSDSLSQAIVVYSAPTYTGNVANIKNCRISNLDSNAAQQNSLGIAVLGEFETVEITNNVVREVTRCSGADANISAVGILIASGRPVANISNNAISGIYGHPDLVGNAADGIAIINTDAGNPDAVPGVVTISNNELYNCHGRFIKLGTAAVNVVGNKLIHDAGSAVAGFEGISFLRGGANVENNTYVVDSALTVDGGYSLFYTYSSSYLGRTENLINIENNHIVVDKVFGSAQHVLTAFVDSTATPSQTINLVGNEYAGLGGSVFVRGVIDGTGTIPLTVLRVNENRLASFSEIIRWEANDNLLATYTNTLNLTTECLGNEMRNSPATTYVIHTSPETNSVGRIKVAGNNGLTLNRVVVGQLRFDDLQAGSDFFFEPGSGIAGLTCASGTIPASFTGAINGINISKPHNVTTLTRVDGIGAENVQGFTQSGTSYFGDVFP